MFRRVSLRNSRDRCTISGLARVRPRSVNLAPLITLSCVRVARDGCVATGPTHEVKAPVLESTRVKGAVVVRRVMLRWPSGP